MSQPKLDPQLPEKSRGCPIPARPRSAPTPTTPCRRRRGEVPCHLARRRIGQRGGLLTPEPLGSFILPLRGFQKEGGKERTNRLALRRSNISFPYGGRRKTDREGESKMFIQKAWRTAAFGLYGFTQFTKSGFVEHAKKFREEDMQIRLDGKNCLVTGANSGIGFATAEGLASHGATVYLLCRNKERGETALNQIRSKTGNMNVHLEICDLSSNNEVKSFATKFSSMDKPLHVLVNNAGLLEHKRATTSEGLEVNFAVNVAATYTLTELVMPLLEKAAPDARVITVASGGMYTEPLNKDLQFSESNFDGTQQYARNKRVQVALTEWWADKYSNKGVGFYSMHPGWADTPGVAKSLPGLSEKLPGNLRSNNEGADTVIWLALQPKEKLVPGDFYFDRAEAPKHLKFAGTAASHAQIGSIVDSIRSICGLAANS